jgi:lysophospholipase L1-like esterase
MTDIASSANDTFRDYETAGVPSSGEHEPEKSAIRETFATVASAVASVTAGNGAGFLTYATLSAMNGDTKAAGITAQNLEDSNIYRSTGAAWTLIGPNPNARLTAIEGAFVTQEATGLLRREFVNLRLASTVNTAINTSGVRVASTGRYASDLIKVNTSMKITRFGAAVTAGSFPPYAFYDAAGTFIVAGIAYTTGADSVDIYDLANAPAGTEYVRLTAGSSTVEYYLYEPETIELVRDLMFSLFGTPVDVAGQVTNQYVNKSTGVVANSSAFRLTPALVLSAGSYIATNAMLISQTITNQAQYAFFDVADAFLGYYNPKARGQTVKVSDLYPTATSVRVTMPSDGVGEVYVVAPRDNYDQDIQTMAAGLLVDYFAPALVSPGRLTLTGGTTQPTHEYYRTTGYIAVTAGQVFRLTSQDATALGAVVAAFGADKGWLANLLVASTGTDFADELVTIPETAGDDDEAVAFIRAMFRNDETPYSFVSVRAAQAIQEAAGRTVLNAFGPDAAYGRKSEAVYLYAAGVVGDRAVPVDWSPDPPQAFATFVGSKKARVTRTAAVISTVTMTIASPCVVSHSGHDIVSGQGVVFGTSGALPTGLTAGVEYFAKTVVAGTSYQVAATVGGDAINTSGSQSGTHKVTPQINIDVGAMVGTTHVDISTLKLRLSDTTALVSPTKKINIVVIGDSTTSQLSTDPEATDGNGTWVNEMSRQLTGTGDVALVVAADGVDSINTGSEWGAVVSGDIRPALGVTNVFYRGTRGSGTVKHEGRGGWHPINYLERTDVVGADGKSNAFWDPDLAPWGPVGTTWQFSMKYFVENNGWDVAALPASGVDATGTNLLVIIALGWNDVGNLTGPAVSAGHMGYIVDKINEEYPAATVWVAGMWAPPEESYKGNTGSIQLRYSSAATYDLAVRQFGEAYRAMAADRAFCHFVQVSHQMDPDYCFSKSPIAPNRVANSTTLNIYGTGDHVHMRRRGYAMLADVTADKFLYDYCRGV